MKALEDMSVEEYNSYIETMPPQSITARQARIALLHNGLLDDIEAMLAINREYQITWEYATEIERNHPIISAMALQTNITEEQIDNLFIYGATL